MAAYIDLSEKHGHRADHGFTCGAEFNVKIRRRIDIPDFVREQLSESVIDEVWREEAGRARDSLRDTLSRRYKWIGEMAFVGRGAGWLGIEDTGCGSRNWDTIGKVVDQHLKAFIKSMESPRFWNDEIGGAASTTANSHLGRSKVHHATKKSPEQLQREIDDALVGTKIVGTKIKPRQLQCDMRRDCPNEVTHVDDKGFVYCTHHGVSRRGSGHRCRKLTASEKKKKKLERRETISY